MVLISNAEYASLLTAQLVSLRSMNTTGFPQKVKDELETEVRRVAELILFYQNAEERKEFKELKSPILLSQN